MGRVEIVTLTVGARAKEGQGGGKGEKKYACPISLFFWETLYIGKRSSWLVRHREVDWCLSINSKAILFITLPGFHQSFGIRLRVVPHFSSGIVEWAKRERAWKSPHARKGDTRWGERKMRDYRQSPSFWPFTADWFWSVKFVSPSKSIKRIQWDSFPHWAVIALVIGKLRGIFIASKRKPRY